MSPYVAVAARRCAVNDSTARPDPVDSNGVTGSEHGDDDATARDARSRLRAVDGPVTGRPPAAPPVRLLREFKGLTVADLLRDELADRLPGQVRSALSAMEQGDWRTAEQAMPGAFAPVLPGPGHATPSPRPRVLLLAVVGALVGTALAVWLQS